MGNRSENISTRSLVSEIEKNEMLYQKQMVYIVGIAVIVFILVIINMLTNLKYRMFARTKEICIYRAIGMSIKTIRNSVMFENITLFLVGSLLSGILLQPVLRYMYEQSSMKSYGHLFHFDYVAYGAVVIVALMFCVILSATMTKDWKTKRIVERMDIVE